MRDPDERAKSDRLLEIHKLLTSAERSCRGAVSCARCKLDHSADEHVAEVKRDLERARDLLARL